MSKKKKHEGRNLRALWWAIQDLNPGPSGYENHENLKIPFFLCNSDK